MKRKLSTFIIILIFIAGLSLLLYPTVSNYLKSIRYGAAILDYQRIVQELEPEHYEEIMARAEEYNKALAKREAILSLTEEEIEDYLTQIKLPGTDVMGYVVIPKINVSLPIYHGTSESVLQNGVGHLEGSSLPIGGTGTHAVLSGHRGLPSARLFTDIDRMKIGDTFQVRVRGEILLYEVDEIQVVLPHEVDFLQINPEEDYCTLLTCTPYGVNSHRLLIRGSRIPLPENESEDTVLIEDVPLESGKIFGFRAEIVLLITAGLGIVMISLFIIVLRRLVAGRAYEEDDEHEEEEEDDGSRHEP